MVLCACAHAHRRGATLKLEKIGYMLCSWLITMLQISTTEQMPIFGPLERRMVA